MVVFSLRELTRMHCVQLALWTRKVLCGRVFMRYTYIFIHSWLDSAPRGCCHWEYSTASSHQHFCVKQILILTLRHKPTNPTRMVPLKIQHGELSSAFLCQTNSGPDPSPWTDKPHWDGATENTARRSVISICCETYRQHSTEMLSFKIQRGKYSFVSSHHHCLTTNNDTDPSPWKHIAPLECCRWRYVQHCKQSSAFLSDKQRSRQTDEQVGG